MTSPECMPMLMLPLCPSLKFILYINAWALQANSITLTEWWLVNNLGSRSFSQNLRPPQATKVLPIELVTWRPYRSQRMSSPLNIFSSSSVKSLPWYFLTKKSKESIYIQTTVALLIWSFATFFPSCILERTISGMRMFVILLSFWYSLILLYSVTN